MFSRRIAIRAKVAGGFVHGPIDVSFGLNRMIVDCNLVSRRIDLRSKLANRVAVDLDPPGSDEVVAMPA